MSQLARNTFLLTAASTGQKAVAFLYFALIARHMGEASTGSYFLALGLITTVGVFDDLGLTSVLVREVAKDTKGALVHVRNVLGNKLVTFPFTIVLAFFLPVVLGFGPEAAMLTRIAFVIMLLDTISLSYYGVLRGMQNLKYESLGIFLGQTITTVIGVSVVYAGLADVRFLIVALICGSGWNAVFSVYQVVRRLGPSAMVPSFSEGIKPLKEGFMFFLAAVFTKIYSYFDSNTLNTVIGPAAVGIYAVAYKLTYAFQFLPLAFVGALYPTMSAQAHEPEKLRKTFLQAEWYLALIAAPTIFGLFALAPEIIGFFYGAKFAGAAPTLQILVFALLFIFLDFPVGSLLNATGRQHIKTGIMGATMVINIVSNLIFVPMLGIPGAAVSALISFSFMFFAGYILSFKVVKIPVYDFMVSVGGSFASGGVMAAVVLIAKMFLPWIITVPIGALVFFVVAFATRSITLDHLRALWQLVPHLRQNGIREEISETV